MSGETEGDPSGWTIDSLHQHLARMSDERDRRYEQRFDAQQRATEMALSATKEAVLKAEHASDKRFDGVNEFRAQLSDQAAMLMPRMEADQRLAALTERVSDLTTVVTKIQGRSSGIEGAWGYLLGAVGLAAAVISMVVR